MKVAVLRGLLAGVQGRCYWSQECVSRRGGRAGDEFGFS